MLLQMMKPTSRTPEEDNDGTGSNRKDLTVAEGTHLRRYSSQATFTDDGNMIDVELHAGDTASILRPKTAHPGKCIVCVFHTSPIAGTRGFPRERIVWLAVERTKKLVWYIRTVALSNVVGMPMYVVNPPRLTDSTRTTRDRRNCGVLINGDRYVVYRVSLYADGFQQSKSSRQSKSVGGVYLLPVGLPDELRNSQQSVRPLCLTVHGLPINEAVKKIMEDLEKFKHYRDFVEGITNGGMTYTLIPKDAVVQEK